VRSQPFALPDGAQTVVEWFGPDGPPAKGLVAFLPALGASVDYYRTMAEAWAGLGYRVATVEPRGGKQSSVRDLVRQNFGYRELLEVDLATILPALRAEAAGRPFILAGHSLGGHFALLHAGRHRAEVDAVVLLAGGSNSYRSLRGRQRLGRHLGVRVVRGIGRLLGYFPGHKLGFGGKQPLNLILDWSHEALTGGYRVKGDPFDHDRALRELDLPVLLVSLAGDRLVPRSSADHLAGRLPRAQVTQLELHTADGSPYHHFRWAKAPGPVLSPVDEWLGMLRSRS
jgi:predicted alpha/beta hydrolase